MSIIRIHKDRGEFSVLPKAAVNDTALSWEARGMLAYLLDKPDNWQVRFENLVKGSPAGEDKTRRILRELEQAGYIVRRRLNSPDGTFTWESEVYETPQPSAENRHMVEPQPSAGLPHVVKPSMVKPHVVNRQIYEEQEEQQPTQQKQEEQQETPPPSGAVPGSAPVKGKSPRAKPDAPEPEQRLMFGAVATVCRLDPRLKAGQIGKTAKQLLAAGYTPDQVEAFPAWFKSHWKGKTGQPPSTGDLLALMLQATQAPNGKPGPATGQQWADTSYEALKARYAPDALQGLIEY